MQTLIIGGLRGLGAALSTAFGQLGRVTATGKELDIASAEARHLLVGLMKDEDIIINNAYNGNGQRDLMLEAFNAYKDTDKIFINIESVNAWREGNLTNSQIEYATDKLALVTARRHLQKLDRKMVIIGICPSTIDTEFNKAKQIPKISVAKAAQIIYDTTLMSSHGVEISEIHFRKI